MQASCEKNCETPVVTEGSTKGSQELLQLVRGLFITRGETLKGWCDANGIKLQNARHYLLGNRNGKVACEWRERIVRAAKNEGV
jgi:hypothetical protein